MEEKAERKMWQRKQRQNVHSTALKMEGGQEPRNVGSLQKLEEART